MSRYECNEAISHGALRICNDFLCEMCGYSYASLKNVDMCSSWNLKLFSFAFTEWYQDGIGGGLKDSTITSNWCSLVEDDWNTRNVYL